MKQILIKKGINCLIFVVAAFLLECISFSFMFNNAFAQHFYLEILAYLILSLPIFFVKSHKMDLIYLSLLMFLLTVLACINSNYYIVLGDIFSLQYLAYLGEGASVIEESFINFFHLSLVFSVLILFIFAMFQTCLIHKNKKIEKEKVKYSYLKCSLMGVVLLVVSIASYMISFNGAIDYEKEVENNYLIDLVTISKPENFNTLGMLSYYTKEFDYLFMSDLSQNEDYEVVRRYFANEIETDNEYTGLLEGYNVVTIMIETGATWMVNETLTPNLYMMLNDGLNATRNYSKNKTNVAEYIGVVGNYPSSGLKNKEELVLPFSAPAMMPEEYNTMYFHDVGNNRDIYSRKKLMPILGFEKSYFHEDLLPGVEEWHWGGNYTLDSTTVESVIDVMLQDTSTPFYAFYTSLSMHGPYVNPSNKTKLKNLYYEKLKKAEREGNWVNPLKDDERGNEDCFINYTMACMDFDAALGKMIASFEEAGIFDKTLFVLYGDHDIYYEGKDKQPLSFSLSGEYDLNHYAVYDTVLGFYNPKLNNLYHKKNNTSEIKQFCSPNVVVPTILDLLGIDYNANMYLGDSIFASQFEKEQIFYSYELSTFFNENYLSTDALTIERVFNESDDDGVAFLNSVTDFVVKQSYIDKIYQSNIFKDNPYEDFNYR